MLLRMSNPLEAVLSLQRALDGVQRSGWFEAGTSGAGAYPPVNVFRKGDDLMVVAELPGADRDTLNVEVKGRQLRISGKKAAFSAEQVSLHRRERSHGSFDRTLTMPADIDQDAVKADYRDGKLAVYLPRPEQDKPRSIRIG